MPKTLRASEIQHIVSLRETGHSLPEIKRITGFSNATVCKYIRSVVVSEEYVAVLRQKQGGSKSRAAIKWNAARTKASELMRPPFTDRELMLVLAALYWGEGTKLELNIVNGDPDLLRLFVKGMKKVGVKEHDFRATVRVYGNGNEEELVQYWSAKIALPTSQFVGFEKVAGTKEIKLPFGMCPYSGS